MKALFALALLSAMAAGSLAQDVPSPPPQAQAQPQPVVVWVRVWTPVRDVLGYPPSYRPYVARPVQPVLFWPGAIVGGTR
jgi:hypothetical protein